MSKEEKNQLPGLVQELVKGEELVGLDLTLSPSLESQACGYNGAGPAEVTAQALSETVEQIEKNTAQEEEILTKRRGSQTCEGEQLNRFQSSAVDEELPFPKFGSEQVAEYYRLDSSKMEKHDSLQKYYNNLPKRAQTRIDELQSSYEASKLSNKKDKDSARIKKLSQSHESPNDGHVKGLQKVFENISSREEVSQHGTTAKSKQYGSLSDKNCPVPQDVSVVPGVHSPVYSQVYNPLKKDHLKKKSEHATVSVIDSSTKLYPSLILQSHSDTNMKSAKTKDSSSNEIAENKTNHRHAIPPLQDLKLPPRTPTPPPQRTKNNFSFCLGSPKGWKHERVIDHSPKVFFGQRFKNQSDTISPMRSPTLNNFSFTGGSVSNTMPYLEIRQKLRNTERKSYIISPGEINKINSIMNSPEENKAQFKTSFHLNVHHDVGHAVSAKETLHRSGSERGAAIIKNEIQGEYETHEDSGQTNELKNKFSALGTAERKLKEAPYNTCNKESVNFKPGDQEDYAEETINSNKSHGIPPTITQRKRSSNYSRDVNVTLKMHTPRREELKETKDSNNQNVGGILKKDTAENTWDVGTLNKSRNDADAELSTDGVIKRKNNSTINFHRVVNHDSVQLSKGTDKDKTGHYDTSTIEQQDVKETISKKELFPKHKAEERKPTQEILTHTELGIKSKSKPNIVLSISQENQSTKRKKQAKAIINQAIVEQIADVSDKIVNAKDQERDIMVQLDNKVEKNTNVAGIAVNDINVVPINKEVVEHVIDQPEIEVIKKQSGHMYKSVYSKNLDKIGQEIALSAASTKDCNILPDNKVKDLMDQDQNAIVSVTTKDRLMENSSDLVVEISKDEPTIDIIKNQIGDFKRTTVDNLKEESTNLFAKGEYMYEQNTNSNDLFLRKTMYQKMHMDPNLIVKFEDQMDQDQTIIVNVENSSDLPDENSIVNIKRVNIFKDQTEEVDKKTVVMKDQTGQEIIVLLDSFIESSDQPVNNLKEESASLLSEGEYIYEQNKNIKDLFLKEASCQRMCLDPNLIVKVEHLMDQDQTFLEKEEAKYEPVEDSNDLSGEKSAVKLKIVNITEDQTAELNKKPVAMKDHNEEIVVLVDSFIESSNQPVNSLKEAHAPLLTEVEHMYEQNIHFDDLFFRKSMHQKMHVDPNLIGKVEALINQDKKIVVNLEAKDETVKNSSDLPDENSAVKLKKVNITEELNKKPAVIKDQPGQEIDVLQDSFIETSNQLFNSLKEAPAHLLAEVEHIYEQTINSNDLLFRKSMHQKMHMDPNLIDKVEALIDQDQKIVVNLETKDETVKNSSDLPYENSAVKLKKVNITEELNKKPAVIKHQPGQEIVVEALMDQDQVYVVNLEAKGEPVDLPDENLTVNIKTESIIEDRTKEEEQKTVNMKSWQEIPVDLFIDYSDQSLSNVKENDTYMLDKVEDLDQPSMYSHHLLDTCAIYQTEDTSTVQYGDAIVDETVDIKDFGTIKENSTENAKVVDNGVDMSINVINQIVNNIIMDKRDVIAEDYILDTINHCGHTFQQSDDMIPMASTKSLFDEGAVISDQDKGVIIKLPENEFVDQAGEKVLEKAGDGTSITPPAIEKLAVDYFKFTSEHKLEHIMEGAGYVIVDKAVEPASFVIMKDMLTDNGSDQTNEDQEDHAIYENERNGNINKIISTTNMFKELVGDIIINQAGKVDLMKNNNVITEQTEEVTHDIKEVFHTIDIMVSANDQPDEISKSKLSEDTVNHVVDMVNQSENMIDVVYSKEDQAENENDKSHVVTVHSIETQNTFNLPLKKTIYTQECEGEKNIKISDYIMPVAPLEKLRGDILGNTFSKEDTRTHTADERHESSSISAHLLQDKQRLLEEPIDFLYYKFSNMEEGNNEFDMKENVTHDAEEEETESSENMEIWVNKLRQLDTPEFMKYQREPRQPRSSPLHMYATLPPIKEDQGSPKASHSDLKWHMQEQKEELDMDALPSQSDSELEAKVIEQTETTAQTEKKYSWERSTERTLNRSSPLELMRKHSGDEASRSDSYKALITQNLSQRQSSIIGSLLLSDRLDKKTEASEGKSYSRLESSLLLSSYMKPKKDKIQEMPEETETPSQKVSSTDDTSANSANSTLSNTLEDFQPENNSDFSQPQDGHVTNSDSTELLSKLDTPVASPLKVFPDVWHHPGKSHGKLNPRPGKIILFSEPGFRGQSHEIYSDVGYKSHWELQGSISVRIIRGGWLLYEKPHFRGRRVMLSEGETDLSCPWEEQDQSSNNLNDDTKKPTFWIGSLRHVVRDFQVPRVSLFMNENGEGNKVTIVGATPDSRVYGQPTKTESIIVHSGLWLLYSKPFFEGDPYILESGGYPNRKAWNGLDSHLCSLQPARIGGPTVEKPNEPKILLFQFHGFEGHSWEVDKDLHSLQGEPNIQGERLITVGSLKVLGGCWVGYEKEGFHGHQYLLEEGEYKESSQWGGCTEELGSLRHINTDFWEPEIVLYENPGCLEGPCLRLNEALADIEVAKYGTSTGSIHVLNGVWVAYENVDFSGEQYILEKGIYHTYHDWGAKDSRVCSVQPVLQVGGQNLHYFPKIQLFSEPNFHGDCMIYVKDQVLIPENFPPQSCRVEGGSWILYEGADYCGEQYILAEGDFPTRTAMACQEISMIRSLKKVPLYFSIPSISLHGLESFEGKELEFTGEVRSLQGEGYNNHVLSVRVASGIWVLYEHNDFRGRQWLLEHTQIPNWLLYSGLQRIGSLCPIRQRRVYFRLRNRALGLFLCVPEPTEDMKAGRVQVTELKEGSCDLWYYEEGRIKNQLAPQMSLQIVGKSSPGTKVVMWSEGRKPIQTWTLEDSGLILSCLFKGLCLDIKGGHSYDSDHVVVWENAEDRLTQLWDLQVF
ncbi:beta/gamma crystallin domain-containing protein 2 [Mixophyes fleayi]|uniref:beta/gamma crystallin domain-containing protein 2 n=1 Tax=Mixophyes fleayi TaxID=3061075 RepID=UPI003F4DCA3A